MNVTPAHRFAAFDLEHEFPVGWPTRKVINAARYWEGFPESYTPAQVAAAQRLLLAVKNPSNEEWDTAVAGVKALL